MELKGTVLNVVDFGAFVDIGLKDSGLVHISQMANRYIKSPYDVVSVNDVVTVWVLNVDQERHRVSLSMIKPGTERRGPERRPPSPRPPHPAGPRPPQQGGPRPPHPQHAKGPRRGPPQGPPAGRPPRGRGPGRGPQPVGEGQPVAEGARPAEPPRPAPPPRKPRREPPKPKLTKEAIEGKVPLRTFGELSALFAAKREEPRKPPEPPLAALPPTDTQAPTTTETPSEPPQPPPESPPQVQGHEGNAGTAG